MSNLKFVRTSMHAVLGAALIFFFCALTAQPALADETGVLKGVIMDADGAILPGATVTIEGSQGTKKAVTSSEGVFRFPLLLPGRYTVKAEMDGFQTVIQEEIWIRSSADTLVDIEMPPSKVAEEITVVAQAPVIDVTTTEVGENISAETMERLPTTRNYQDLFNFVPGVQGRTDTENGGEGTGNASVRGEGNMSNNYLIDGISARDPDTNGYGHNINFEAIEEIQIMTDGFSAEYGRATGLLANVITKSGGNQLEGSILYNYLDTSSGTATETERTGRTVGALGQEYHNPAINLGGPIIKDKLWYFGSIDYLDATWDDSGQFANYGFEYTRDDTDLSSFFKTTWSMNENHSIYGSWVHQDFERENQRDFDVAPEGQRGDDRDMDHLSATYRGILSADTFLEVKFGQTDVARALVPYGSMDLPDYEDRITGESFGGASMFDYDTTQRDYKFHFTQYLDDLGGDHSLKAGVEYLEAEKYEIWLLPGNGYSYTYADGVPESLHIQFQQPGDGNTNSGYVAFLQDTWDVAENVTLNLGYRYESLAMENNRGDEYFDFATHAPRLGAVWDVTSDSRNVVKAFWGRFFDFTGLTSSWYMNTSSTSSFDQYNFNPDADGTWTDDFGNTWDGAWEWEYTQGGEEGVPLFPLDTVDPNLTTHHADKLILSYERKLTDTQAVGLRYVDAKTRDLIEDIQTDAGEWFLINMDSKRRDYWGVDLTYRKAMSNNLMIFGSYTYSESKGTTPGQHEWGDGWGSSDTVGVYGDSPPSAPPGDIWYGLGSTLDDQGWYGYLPDDIRNHVKLNGLYRAPWDVDVGLAFKYSSGQAYSRRSWNPLYGNYFGFPEGRGTYRLPDVYWFDLHLEKTFPIGERYGIGAFFDILNLLDGNKVINVWEWDAPEEANNPFGTPRFRQTGRQFRVGLRFSF